MRVVFVHGACVRDGAWWWHRTAELLLERGVPSVAPLLPSCGEDGRPGGTGGPGLPEDVAAVRQVLQDGEEPTVVVAHSYGGIVIAEAAAGVSSVHHLVLVSSYLPEVGQSLSDFGDGTPAPFLDIDMDSGTFGVRPELLVETFLQDCDAGHPDRGRRQARSTERAGHGAARRCGGLAGRCPRPISSAPRTGERRHGCSATSPARPGPSSSWTPATIPSCPNRPPFGTCCSACDAAASVSWAPVARRWSSPRSTRARPPGVLRAWTR